MSQHDQKKNTGNEMASVNEGILQVVPDLASQNGRKRRTWWHSIRIPFPLTHQQKDMKFKLHLSVDS